MADQVLKDAKGKVIGKIRESSGKLEIFDAQGRRKGYYDPKINETRSEQGKVIGKGNLLVMLL